MTKVYLLSFTVDPQLNTVAAHNYITAQYPTHLSDWWHYIPGMYLVASTLDVQALYSLLFPAAPGRNLLVMEVNPKNAQGWLPGAAWDWIRKYQI